MTDMQHLKPLPFRCIHVLKYVAMLTVFLLTACGGAKGGGANVSSDPETAFRDALKRQATAAPYRVTNKVTMDGATTTQVIDFVSPQTMAMKSDDMEIRLVDGKAYQLVDGAWQDSSMASAVMGGMASMYNPEAVDELIGTLRNVRESGAERVNGETARVYEYDSEQVYGTMKVTSALKLWVRESDGLPLKQVAETETDGVKSSTVVVVEYDPNLKVEAPN